MLQSSLQKKFVKADDWSDLDTNEWRNKFPNFAPWEMKSWNGSVLLYVPMLHAFQNMRDDIGEPIRFSNVYRNPYHNRMVGGRKNSDHLKGRAGDIIIPELSNGEPDWVYAHEIERLALKYGFNVIGRYLEPAFIHIGMRPYPPGRNHIYQFGKRKWPEEKGEPHE